MTVALCLAAFAIGAAWNWNRARYWRTECLAAEHDLAAPSRRTTAIGPGVPVPRTVVPAPYPAWVFCPLLDDTPTPPVRHLIRRRRPALTLVA